MSGRDPAGDGIGQPANAPGQEARILAWLLTEPGGLTQLEALQHLAVQRLAAMVYRLKGRGHAIRTELVPMHTRYGEATVARYHLDHMAKGFNPATVGVPRVDRTKVHPGDLAELEEAQREGFSFGQADGYIVRSDGKYLADLSRGRG